MIRPHVQAEIDATRAALARLRLVAQRVCLPPRKPAASAKQATTGAAMIALDDAYTAATGTVLTLNNAPMRQLLWFGNYRAVHKTGPGVRWTGIMALYRLRYGQNGCRPNTLEAAIVYFSAIWPEGAIWSASVARPTSVRRSVSA